MGTLSLAHEQIYKTEPSIYLDKLTLLTLSWSQGHSQSLMRQRAWNQSVIKILLEITTFGKLLKQVDPEHISDESKKK